ncbi:MAG: hypothetical protein NXH87_02220 [Rhodobiaceae bacterium]|nr:hypothetical protein [Rhodobiaceae bacterium]
MLNVAIAFTSLGGIYCVTAMQAYTGFWPFFRRHPESLREKDASGEELIKIMIPYVFSAIGVIVVCVATGILEFVVGLGVSLWGAGLRVRTLEKKRENGALPGFYQYLPETAQKAFARRPMLAFDVWTMGTTAIVAIVFLLPKI